MPNETIRLARVTCSACTIAIAAACCVLISAADLPGPPPAPARPDLQAPSPFPPLILDAIVIDNKGSAVGDMKASDFEVLVDGKPRVGLAIARLFRGPGAAGLVAARQAPAPGEMPPLAEPSRIIIFAVDQGSFLPGDERRARLIVENCLGLVGLNDRLMFITLPDLGGSQTLSADRDPLRQGLGRVRPLRLSYSAPADAPPPDALKPTEPAEKRRQNEPPPEETGAAARSDALAKLNDLMLGEASQTSETISPPAAKAHAVAMLDSLRQMLDGLRVVPGSKTVFLLSAGLIAAEASVELQAATAAAATSFSRIFTIQVPTPASRYAENGRNSLLALARATGGAFVALIDKPAQALQRTVSELSFSYLLMLSPQPGDLQAGLRTVSVRTRRRDVTIRTSLAIAPGRLLPEAPSAPPAVAPSPAVPTPGKAPATGVKPAPAGEAARRPAAPRDPALEAVLARVTEYADNYGREFSAIVAEEVYEQQVTRAANVVSVSAAQQPSSRRLVSDFLLVKFPGADSWMPFRDVFEVDGVQVRDRDVRLKKLFLDASPEKAVENANTIWKESARYNLGPVRRDINVPTVPLMFVSPAFKRRFEFTKRGEPTEAGIRAWEIEYREVVRPTIVKTPAGVDVMVSGTLWVDPVSGRILRTLLRAAGATITVTYRPREEATGLWLPVMMQESYVYATAQIQATATYSNFRRFQVFTEEKIKQPDQP